MYERILVPLDGSKIGEAALPYVEELVSKLSPEVKVEVTLLQVLSPVRAPIVGGYETPAVDYTRIQAEEQTMKAMDYLTEIGETLRSKGVTVFTKVGTGSPAEEIVKAADEINADLIAMSTHGRSGLSRWAFGSITDKILRQVGKVAVLVVKAPREVQKT